MPYLVAPPVPAEPAGDRFRALIKRGGIVRIPGRPHRDGVTSGPSRRVRDLAGLLLRVANKALERLYAAIRRDGASLAILDDVRSRAGSTA
jgi:hypothetical protein